MNQRIIKLISLALREIESIPVEQVTAGRIDDYGIVEIPNTFGEKLAELIVRECTYQCYLIGESGLAHELSDNFGFKFDFRKIMEEEDE